MDISDIFAVLTYVALIFMVLSIWGSFVGDINSYERMRKTTFVFFIIGCIFGIITVLTMSDPTPSRVIKVEHYNSYTTEEVDDGTIYCLGNSRTLKYEDDGFTSDDSNKDIITKNIYGKKPKYRAKLVIKGFSDAQKAKLNANSWNFAKLMRTYNSPNDKSYTLYLYKVN